MSNLDAMMKAMAMSPGPEKQAAINAAVFGNEEPQTHIQRMIDEGRAPASTDDFAALKPVSEWE